MIAVNIVSSDLHFGCHIMLDNHPHKTGVSVTTNGLSIRSESMRGRLARRWLKEAPGTPLSRRLRAAMDYLDARIRRECDHELGPVINLATRSTCVCIYCGYESDCDY